MKIIVNPDQELVAEIRTKLKENKELYGKQYCPCVPKYKHNDDAVCMCKNFREQVNRGELGECHCGYFVLVND